MKNHFTFVKICSYLILSIGIIIVIFPMYLTIVTSFKTTAESAENFFSWPNSLFLGNYVDVINSNNFLVYFSNSVFVTVFSVFLIILYIPAFSFVISRSLKKQHYYRFLFYFITIGIFVPFQILMIPVIRIMSSISLMNHSGLSLLYMSYAQIQGVFICTNYMMTIPTDLDESAYIDGCSIFRVIYSIIFPLAKPIVATLGIINILWIWNDFLLPLLVLNRSKSLWTLPLFQYNFKTTYSFDFNIAFAAFMLSIVPIMLVYLFAQKYIINGLTGGSVKQ